uniref:(northern house mosquito) hypothetical protein n=1 Tax=Culex pipiens TaxID=7175 RepID=A0A8D8K3C0_CULPI
MPSRKRQSSTFRSRASATGRPPRCARTAIGCTWQRSLTTRCSSTTRASALPRPIPISWRWVMQIGPPFTLSRESSSLLWPTLPSPRGTNIRRTSCRSWWPGSTIVGRKSKQRRSFTFPGWPLMST